MFRALFVKELRESWWLGLLPLAMMLYYSAVETEFGRVSGIGFGFRHVSHPERYHEMPFGTMALARSTLLWGSLLAGGLGLWQTFRESQSRTWHFLFYRPVDRFTILWAKVSAAAVVYTLAILIPVLAVCLWAATPGTHASPFRWLLTYPAWYAVAAGPVFYLAALFAGMRRGHLLGTRWWPLIGVAASFGSMGNEFLPTWRMDLQIAVWAALLVGGALLVAPVRDELQAADFS